MEKDIKLLKALADNNRLRVICLIFLNKKVCACAFADILKISQPGVSVMLNKLKSVGMLKSTKKGFWVEYEIADDLPEFVVSLIKNFIDRAEIQADQLKYYQRFCCEDKN